MASMSESQRAKLFTALAISIGTEEADVLGNALNLDGQLASRDELRTEIFAVREDMRTEFAAVRDEMRTGLAAVRDEMRTGFADVRVTIAAGNRALFFQLLTMQMTMFGLVIGGVKLLG